MSTKEIFSTLSQIAIIDDADQYKRRLNLLCKPSRPYILSFINQHGFNIAHHNPSLRHAFLKSDCLLRDGVGLEIALHFLGLKSGVNCNGTDLIPRILKQMTGRTAAVYGTTEPWLGQACAKIEAAGVHVVSKLDGFQDEATYLSAVQQCKPSLIILGMGMPRQEELSLKIAETSDHACLIVNGGAIIDFLGDRFARAPKWVQSARLEWLFRLLLEPKRLFTRYITGGAVFLFRMAKLAVYVRAPSAKA